MPTLLWITKTAESRSLSQSEGQERLDILSQAQAVSRYHKANQRRKPALISAAKSAQRIVTTEYRQTSTHKTIHASRRTSKFRTTEASSSLDLNFTDLEQAVNYTYARLPEPTGNFQLRDPDQTIDEHRGTVFFREVAVYKILTVERDREFWHGVVPYLAQVDPGIRHIVVAIAATYELLSKPCDTLLNQFALLQCNKAVRFLLSQRSSWNSLIASSILIVAYHLLRTDTKAADQGIESGLKMLESFQTLSGSRKFENWSYILVSLSQQHGYKLWTPDVAFKLERTVAGSEDISVSQIFPKGPFTNVAEVLAAFKIMMLDVVAKVMRNVSLGAHVDPNCIFAYDVGESFSTIFFHWRTLRRSFPDTSSESLQLVQLKIGLLLARLLFHAKLLAADEMQVDAHIDVYTEIVQLAQEVLVARRAGRPVVYMDRIVNGTLYTCSMFCREPTVRRILIAMLKGQINYSDGLVNFLRGHSAEIVADIEEHDLVVNSCYDIPQHRRVGICKMTRPEGRVLCIEYMAGLHVDREILNPHKSLMPAELDKYTNQEIDGCLGGMMGAFAMYRKLDLSKAPKGYLRRMLYGQRPISVVWRDDLQCHQL